jgi:hypothetical protein
MKATIEFDLDDAEDNCKHKLFTHIETISFIIWQIDEDMRRIIKYDETKSEDYKEGVNHIRTMLRDHLMERGISFELFN